MAKRPDVVRVAVVDDHRMVLDGLAAHLAQSGLEVVIAVGSWGELVEHPAFPADVTVLDLNLGDGLRIESKVQALRAAGSHVVIVSRHAGSHAIARSLHAGALAFVPKSAPAAELTEAVEAVARGERYPSDAADLPQRVTTVSVGPREQRALALYAAGRSIREVAAEMEATEETVKSYIKRARSKYRRAGIDLGTKILLLRHAVHEGWLDSE